MALFAAKVARAAQSQHVVPLLPGKNRLELRSFVKRIGQDIQPSGCLTGITEDQLLFEEDARLTDDLLYDETRRGVVFLNGDDLSHATQLAFVEHDLSRLRFVVAVITEPVEALVARGNWMSGFSKRCTSTMRVPEWSERADDHDDIVNEILGRMPDPPELHPAARELLKNTPFRGTDDVKRCLEYGYASYRKDTLALFLTADHLRGNALRALTSRRPGASSTPPGE